MAEISQAWQIKSSLEKATSRLKHSQLQFQITFASQSVLGSLEASGRFVLATPPATTYKLLLPQFSLHGKPLTQFFFPGLAFKSKEKHSEKQYWKQTCGKVTA